jgi:hypothetical protein
MNETQLLIQKLAKENGLLCLPADTEDTVMNSLDFANGVKTLGYEPAKVELLLTVINRSNFSINDVTDSLQSSMLEKALDLYDEVRSGGFTSNDVTHLLSAINASSQFYLSDVIEIVEDGNYSSTKELDERISELESTLDNAHTEVNDVVTLLQDLQSTPLDEVAESIRDIINSLENIELEY